MRRADPASAQLHRKLGGYLFNRTWELLDCKHRSRAEDDEMLHAAHASRYHWGRVGLPVNLSVGEWQLSRVYSVLRRPEPAVHHGQRALAIARRAHLGNFYIAYAHEALARALAIAGRPKERDRHVAVARRLSPRIRDPDDRRMLSEDLATIPAR